MNTPLHIFGWVLLGGAVGAPARYLTDRFISRLHRRDWPWGTFVVNVCGAFAFAAVLAAAPPSEAAITFLLPGVIASFTTWSTFSVEVVRLAQERQVRNAISYLVSTLIVGTAAAYLGYRLFAT